MEMACAGCGCVADRDVRSGVCQLPESCCCAELPRRERTVEEVADRLRDAFDTRDIAALGCLLALDARWGDDDHPNRCRTRADVMATFTRLLDEGVHGTVADAVVGHRGVAVLLRVQWPDRDQDQVDNFYQAYIVSAGVVTEIQRHDDHQSAITAIAP